jgi:hypothetical protein
MVQLLILGEVCSRQHSFTRSFFKVPIQRGSGYTEGIADIGNTGVRVLQERPGHADFPGIHFRRPATISTPCPRSSESGLSPFADEFPFEFRQSPEHMEDQLASAGRRIHALPQTLKSDLAGGKSIYGFDEMLQGTTEPIQLPHDQRVSVARILDGFGETSATIDSAAGDIAEDPFASGLLESVFLQVRILVGGGNPCIADPHAQPPVSELNPDQRF